MATNGSCTFWGNLKISWTYNASKQQLNVSATLNGKSIGSTVLTPANKTGQLQGSDAGNTATVGLGADFTSSVLTMHAHETDGDKSATQTGNF